MTRCYWTHSSNRFINQIILYLFDLYIILGISIKHPLYHVYVCCLLAFWSSELFAIRSNDACLFSRRYRDRSIEITQNATRVQKRKSQAFKSGSNQMADTRLDVRVSGKIGNKCLVMRLRFAVIKEFCF